MRQTRQNKSLGLSQIAEQGAIINNINSQIINKIINKIKQGAKTKTVKIKSSFYFSLFKLEILSHLLIQMCKKAPKLRIFQNSSRFASF